MYFNIRRDLGPQLNLAETKKRIVRCWKKNASSVAKKIAPVYQLLQWHWAFSNSGIPTVDEIYQQIVLMASAASLPDTLEYYCSSGGLELVCWPEDEYVHLEINMKIEHHYLSRMKYDK